MAAILQKSGAVRVGKAINYILLSIFALVCLLPFVHMIAKSFSGATAVSAGRITFWPLDPTLNTYRYVMQDNLFFSSFRNSVIITVSGTLIALAITTMAAYPLSKQHFRGRKIILMLYVFTMLFYGGMVSIYVFMRTLNLLNTLICQIIPLALSQYNLFVMKTFFEGLPEGQDRGCSGSTHRRRRSHPHADQHCPSAIPSFACHNWPILCSGLLEQLLPCHVVRHARRCKTAANVSL